MSVMRSALQVASTKPPNSWFLTRSGRWPIMEALLINLMWKISLRCPFNDKI
jgi:hypothetical protein